MGTPLLWIAFNGFVLIAVALDLGVFNRRLHKVDLREALWSTIAWVSLSVLFGFGVWHFSGPQRGVEFFTGYLIEKALSVDNLFLFLVIFRTFAIDERFQHRMLEWGILGALVMRGVMIFAGAALIEKFSWIMYIFGAFLVYAGVHMLFAKKENIRPGDSAFFRFASRHLRLSHDYRGEHFFVRKDGKLFATPLFLVLLVVEITDITLAIDSIPAIFGITRDPFIVYTSNVFAILGLRAMYFLLAGFLNRLRFLTVGLAFVLAFIGGKMLVEHWVHVTALVSLSVVGGILLLAIVGSLAFPERKNVAT
ncbi:MAG TPA: TerC family protein [Candidatus Acidoferrum sp.]|nr:TerC family protein [Candidatus Acidoferrum sp.]